MKKAIVLAVCLMFVASSAFAFSSKEIRRAKDMHEMGKVYDAISVLESYVYEEPKSFEAYWLMGQWCMDNGNYEKAVKNYNYALKLKSNKRNKVSARFEVAYQNAFAQKNYSKAKSLVKYTANYKPGIRATAHDDFLALAESSQSADHFETAMSFARSHKQRSYIATKYVEIALNSGDNDHHLFREASAVLGSEFVESVKPRIETEVVFERTYSDADTDKEGRITIVQYSKADLREGDVIFVSGNIPEGVDSDVFVADGKGGWVKVPKTHPTRIFPSKESLNKNDTYAEAWLKTGKGVTISVRIEREKNVKANYGAVWAMR